MESELTSLKRFYGRNPKWTYLMANSLLMLIKLDTDTMAFATRLKMTKRSDGTPRTIGFVSNRL
jgi:hypothetical protein